MRISIHPQFGRVMKLTALLLTLGLLEVSARSNSQTITYTAKNKPLEVVFSEIRKQTGYVFFYTSQDLAAAEPVTIEFKNTPLTAALDSIIRDQPLVYRISEHTVFIGKKILPAPTVQVSETSVFVATNPVDVQGRVLNERGEPVAGATVTVKETGKGTHTDAGGVFELKGVDTTATLVFSGVNIETYRLKLHGNYTGLTIILKVRVSALNEIQIVGYGTTTRQMSTGNITSVQREEIKKQNISNFLLALQGRVPGMQITSPSGIPGVAPTVQIRGQNSIAAGTSPLYILDGIPVPEKQFSVGAQALDNGQLSALLGLNPDDIERVDVLKDGDATAIYGSRGGNGVVLITTRRGHSNATHVNLSAYTGIQKVRHFIDMPDVHQYNAMRREAMANDGIVPTAGNSPDLFTWDSTRVHDWQREFLGKTASNSDINLGVTGGNANTNFYINSGYHREGTVFPGSTVFERTSFRANVNHVSVNRKLTVDLSMAYSSSHLNYIQQDMVSYIFMAPDYPLYTASGAPNWQGVNQFPLAYTMQPFDNKVGNYNGSVNLGYQVVDGLMLKLNAGFSNSVTNETIKQPSSTQDPTSFYAGGVLQMNAATGNSWIVEPQAEYSRQFGAHHIKVLAGATFQRNRTQSNNAMGWGFSNDALIGDIGAAENKNIGGSSVEYSYASVFGRVTYDYQQKYLANISFRRDGSSRFGPGNRWGEFGAAGIGWIFSREQAIRDALRFLSYGKIRASYGITGNDQIGDYGYISTYLAASYPPYAYNGASLIPSNLANPAYGWEKNHKFEGGLELGFLKDRILVTGSYFRNRSGNQLVFYTISPQSGFGGYQANFPATVQNQGYELTLSTQNIVTADFSWKTSINLTKSANRLVSFPGIENSSYYNQYFEGQSLGVRQAYIVTGLSNKGVPVFVDKNQDGFINQQDRRIIGNNDPLFGGMSNEFSYKGISLSFFVTYDRNSNFNNVITAGRVGNQGRNLSPYFLSRWRQPGDEAHTIIPKFTTRSATYNSRNFSTADILWRTDHIFRLNNIALSYSLPTQALRKVKITAADVYVHAQNIWVSDKLGKYRLDPLTGNTAMPPLFALTAGINCTF